MEWGSGESLQEGQNKEEKRERENEIKKKKKATWIKAQKCKRRERVGGK